MSSVPSTPSSGSSASGSSEVAGIGIGSNTHQTMQSTVIPAVAAASPANPAENMRYAANNARIGPAARAVFLVDRAKVDDEADMAGKVASPPTAKQSDDFDMTDSFYWYDLETSGTDPRWDRIIQFAGLRTDADLNEVGDVMCSYVTLPDDVLPNPDAALVTGITPELTRAQGISEWQALSRINELFSQPQTCAVGYNSLRFDDEFV